MPHLPGHLANAPCLPVQEPVNPSRRSSRQGRLRNNAYTYGPTVRVRNAANACHAPVIPTGTANAPTANVIGAAHMVVR